jgi:hypothetical protein
MHMDEGLLQAAVDDELPPEARDALSRHLAECERCSGELRMLQEARDGVASALSLLDVPAPMLAARAGIQREARRRRRRGGVAVLRRAALFLIASAAVLSATVPGSPVRGWLVDAWELATGPSEPAQTVTLTAVEEELQRSPAPAGVSLLPPAGQARVVVTSPASGLVLQVRLHEEERLGVWASGPAAHARFLTAADRVEVESPGAGELRIEIPTRAHDVRVEVDGRAYLVKEGDDLRFPGPQADRRGPEIRFQVDR